MQGPWRGEGVQQRWSPWPGGSRRVSHLTRALQLGPDRWRGGGTGKGLGARGAGREAQAEGTACAGVWSWDKAWQA